MKSRGINGRVIHNSGKWGLSECRNIGIKSSRGETVAFVDDDVILDPKCCCSVITPFESFGDMIGATGPLIHPGSVKELTGYLWNLTG